MLELHWHSFKVDAGAWWCRAKSDMGWNVYSFTVGWHQQGFSEITSEFVHVLGHPVSETPLRTKCQTQLSEYHSFKELKCTQIAVPKIANPFGICWLDSQSFLKMTNGILSKFREWRTTVLLKWMEILVWKQWIESSLEEDLRVLVDEKPNVNQ